MEFEDGKTFDIPIEYIPEAQEGNHVLLSQKMKRVKKT